MKYNININQRSVVESKLDLDVIDMAIFNYLESFALSGGTERIINQDKLYFWVSHSKIMEDMPMLNINTRQGVLKRIDKLIAAGLIERHPQAQRLGKSFYCFGVNYDAITHGHLTTAVVTPRQPQLSPPDNHSCHDNSIRDNSIRDNSLKSDLEKSASVQSSLFPEEFENGTKPQEANYNLFLEVFNQTKKSRVRFLDAKSIRQLDELLKKGITVQEVVDALKNAMAEEYHTKTGFKYLTPEFITRPDKFNRFSGTVQKTLTDTDYE